MSEQVCGPGCPCLEDPPVSEYSGSVVKENTTAIAKCFRCVSEVGRFTEGTYIKSAKAASSALLDHFKAEHLTVK